MPDVKIPYGEPGVASFETSDTYENQVLLRGHDPALSPAISGEAGADIRRYEVIGFDGDGNLAPASATIKPVGVATNAAADGERVLYWYAGHFNADMLVWPTYFSTDALKAAAFNGAPSPTRIRVSKRFG